MSLLAVVQPLVMTLEGYRAAFGEDDPEELRLMQIKDRSVADTIGEVLKDLFDLETDLSDPREGQGMQFDLGPADWLHELRQIAAETQGHTVDEFQTGHVSVGSKMNHLINHDEGGFYLPVRFMQAFFVDNAAVGSAPALLDELAALVPALEQRWPQAMARAVQLANVGSDLPEEPPRPLRGPVWTWLALGRLCRSAISQGMAVHLG